MNQDRLSRFGIATLAGYLFVMAASLAESVWLRLVVCFLCLGGAAWWGWTVGGLLRKKSVLLHDLAAEVNEEAERRTRLDAAVGYLIQKMAGRTTLVAALSECATSQRQMAKGVADLLEDVALIQEDFSQLAPELSLTIETDGPAVRSQLAKVLALAETGRDKAAAANHALQGLQASLERVQLEVSSRSDRQLSALEQLLSEVEQGQAALASSAAAMGEWRRPIDEIGRAVQLATDLAEQARILGVNASIEALRSGEAGRGFLLVSEEAERLSDRMLRVAHQMAAQIEESDKTAAVAAKQLEEMQGLLASLNEQGRHLTDQAQGNAEHKLSVPREELEQLAELTGQLAGEVGGLDGRLSGIFGRLDSGPVEEGKTVATRLFGTLSGLAKELKTFAASLDRVCEVAQENESQLEALETAGRDLEEALAATKEGRGS